MLDIKSMAPEQRELIYEKAANALRNAAKGDVSAMYDVHRYTKAGLYKVNRPEADRDYEC